MALVETEIRLGQKIEPSYQSIGEVTDIVSGGGVVVFPWGKLERRCLGLMGDSASTKACHRINRIKTRPEEQVLAVNGYPELIAEIARIEDSQPLIAVARRLRVEPVEVIRRIMTTGAISFIFEARDGVPDTVTQNVGDNKTVMVAGEIDRSGFDFYTELIRNLHGKGVITAGSSANRTTSGTYHVFEQDEAYADLANDVDLFVYHHKLPPRPIHAINLESCSTFDMTIAADYPQVVRFGSVNPARFKEVLGNFTVDQNAQYLPHHEKTHHMWLKAPFYLFDRAA